MRRALSIVCLAAAGVLSPVPSPAKEPGGRPGPDALPSAAQWLPLPCNGIAPFPDVPATHPFCAYIRDLKQDGISFECGGGNYCPENPITRGQLAALLERTMRGTSSWDAWRDGPSTPSGLNWGAKTASSSVGTMMEYSLGLGGESGIYFDDESVILWAPGGTGLVRVFDESQGTDDEVYRFSDGSLSFRPAGLNGTGGDSSFTLRFFDEGEEGNETFRWDNAGDRFELTNDLTFVMNPGDTVATVSTVNAVYFLDLESVHRVRVMLDSNDDADSSPLGQWEVYRNGSYALADIVAFIDELGNMVIRGDLSTNGFDLAEAFWETEPVEPGDVVRIDPLQAGGVLRASQSAAGGVLGVVSSDPGLVLGGALLDAGSLAGWGIEAAARFAAEKPELMLAAERASNLVGRQRGEIDQRRRSLSTLSVDERARVEKELESRARQLEAEIEAQALKSFYARHFSPVALAGRVPVKVDASFGSIRPGDPLAASPVPGVAMRATEPGVVLGTALGPMTEGRGKILMLVDRGWWGGAGERVKPEPLDGAPPAGSVDEENQPLAVREVFDTLRARGAGHAELMDVSEAVELGDVLVMDDGDALRRAANAEDRAVVGVVAAKPALLGGQAAGERAQAAVAVAGVAWIKADAGYGAIERGDLLVSSPNPGHGMRSDDPRPGTVVGKALGSLAQGTGLVRVLVTLR